MTARRMRQASAGRPDGRRERPDRPHTPRRPHADPAPLTADEIAAFRERLLEKRRQILNEAMSLRGELARSDAAGGAAVVSGVPTHPAEIASDTWEQEFAADLFQNRRLLLKEIDDALQRIEDKAYGICEATGRPISRTRLRAVPWARFCIEYARANEIAR